MSQVMWWASVGAYFTAALACVRTAQRPLGVGARIDRIWLSLAGVTLLLGINKAGDFTGIITRAMRNSAWRNAWYAERSSIQATLVFSLGCFAFAMLVLFLRSRKLERGKQVALIVVVYLGCFALVRAVSLHFIDRLLYADWYGFRLNWMIELGALCRLLMATRERDSE